jgi:transcriptional regulator with GAF, ATPase, and Fis domain
VWLKLAAVEEQFHQQQTWEELMRKILQQLTQNHHVTDAIPQVLNTIRQWIQASRILLYQVDRQNYVESVAVGYPALKDFQTTDVNLMAEYREQYQQGKTILIEDISQADLPSAVITHLKQLNTQAMCVVPLKKEDKLSLLAIHFSRVFPPDQLLLNRLSDLGKLLAIAVI